MSAPSISIYSEWMENGSIMDFVATHQGCNRVCLVCERRVYTSAALIVWTAYGRREHKHHIAHGDLKGVSS